MSFAQHCGRGFGDHWRGVIFRREYKHLDDIVTKSKRWFNRMNPRPRFLSSTAHYKWVWPSGEELLFRAFATPDDYWDYHGHEYPFIGWEELTGWPSIDCYEAMKSCNRTSYQGDIPLPLLIRSTTNPFGVGHNWVKAYFIDPAPYGKPIIGDNGLKRVCIFGSIRENRFVDPEYRQMLEGITDPNKRQAWLFGSWDITSGGMFDDLWRRETHVLPAFPVPDGWRIDRSFDWGSSRPFSVGWWAESDGLPVMVNGQQRTFPRGTMIRIGEWYGSNGRPNEGLRMTAAAVARGIREREKAMGIASRVRPGPADSSIYDVTDEISIAQNMEREGVRWVPADKRPGSRKNGWELIRARLEAAGTDKPGLYAFDTCRDFIRTVPTLPRDERDPDDVDTEAEDHVADEVRYRVLAAPRVTTTRPLSL